MKLTDIDILEALKKEPLSATAAGCLAAFAEEYVKLQVRVKQLEEALRKECHYYKASEQKCKEHNYGPCPVCEILNES